MGKILIFAGTTEGRVLSERLAGAGIKSTVCVATEYGKIVLNPHPLISVHSGRMDKEKMCCYILQNGYDIVVDATHPYAHEVTLNIKAAADECNIKYLRLKRDTDIEDNYNNIRYFKDYESCEAALNNISGNILLTTGSKELSKFCVSEDVKERLYVRILPGEESLNICLDNGIFGKHIIAMQGPFSVMMNEAVIYQYDIRCLVTKKSGLAGGYIEKIKAAEKAGIPVYVIGCPDCEEKGYTFGQILEQLKKECGLELSTPDAAESADNTKSMESPEDANKLSDIKDWNIVLAGIGMGSRDNLTTQVCREIENADILLGAQRLIEPFTPLYEKKPLYLAGDIIDYLKKIRKKEIPVKRIVILFSGDSGFYSGCSAVYEALKTAVNNNELQADVSILPGISSVSYLAAKTGVPYQEACICSMHGKQLANIVRKINSEKYVFLLMSGSADVNRLGEKLVNAGMEDIVIYAGYQLSYPSQTVMELTPNQCMDIKKEGLYTLLIINKNAQKQYVTHGRTDSEFIRDKVPMTKQEIRDISICRLRLRKNSVLYDIGSGTGSIAIEAAELSDDIRVYAVEKNETAFDLIHKNIQKFGLENIEVIKAVAPDGMEGIKKATHAFIGGSGGNLKAITDYLYKLNPYMRVVINAVSIETISEINDILSEYPVTDEQMVQVQVNRTEKRGRYHMMSSENPVWICSFTFNG